MNKWEKIKEVLHTYKLRKLPILDLDRGGVTIQPTCWLYNVAITTKMLIKVILK